ncbi:MAG: hypothetical protein JWQ30_1105, partial [Sediminibacterium sp.]|nr:hypothetical protein [Sediminibacterium sp.]
SYFDIAGEKPVFRHSRMPKSFIELFLYNSLYLFVKEASSTPVNLESWLKDYSAYSYNQTVIQKLNQAFKNKNTNTEFKYFHLLMPHSPYTFGSEFPYADLTVDNYAKYWQFTNEKLLAILKNAGPEKYRIIVTGDHGYIGDSINPHNTFGAFYGFDKADVDRVSTVQDIGLLIRKYLIGR